VNFDFSEEQKLLQKTARDYLTQHSPLALARSVLEGGGSHSDELWKGVAEMGWLGAAVPEEFGGAGFGRLELALVTEALLEYGSDEQRARLLPRLASGELIGTFAYAERPGRLSPDQVTTRYQRGKLSGAKLPVPDAQIAGLALAVVREGEALRLALVDLSGQGISAESLESIDGSRPHGRLRFENAPAELLGGDGRDEAALDHLLDRAAVLMAFEQIGGAERALEITREFTLGRYAFGRPIASFQALKHRMADLYAAIQLATSNAYYGAWALSTGDPELSTAACGARTAACDAFDLAGVEMIQMHGGVGYTWEYDCHLFYRRAKMLSLALGGAGEWRERLIQRLEDRGE
jgi:alkylation response protein AidB-like acyl-CoA dehydrogenase